MQPKSVFGFFVVEAKDRGLALVDYIPQVLTRLYAAAKKLEYVSIPISCAFRAEKK